MSTSSAPNLPGSKPTDLDLLYGIAKIAFLNLANIEFLSKRGIGPVEKAKWQLGVFDSPTRRMVADEYGPEAAASVGVTAAFYDRLLFPLRDPVGTLVGFVGRTLTGETPKWIYPSESYLLSRRAHLIGVYEFLQVRSAGIALPPPVVVEGPFDVVQLWKHNIPALGSHGTGLTKEQALILRNLSPRAAYICSDPEEDARTAYRKTVARSRTCLPDILREIRLPDGADPDLFLREQGPEEYKRLMREAKEIF